MSRFGKYIRSQCLADPYIQLLHSKRSLRFLQLAKEGGAHMLILGNKHGKHLNFAGILSGWSHVVQKTTPELITNAPKNYDLVICLDPALYARHLYNINLPCIAVCKVEELYQHRDIPDAFDYIIPLGDTVGANLLDILKATSVK